MAHKHSVYDTDNHFQIDGVTRAVKNVSETKTLLMKGDHNSERFTFEVPRYIDGHDMTQCDICQIHYLNTGSGSSEVVKGIYEVDDLQSSPNAEGEIAILSWLISNNCTQYSGTLNFVIHFACTTDGTVDYVWNTAIVTGITVSNTIYNSDFIPTEFPDILEQWKKELELATPVVKLERKDAERKVVLSVTANKQTVSVDIKDGEKGDPGEVTEEELDQAISEAVIVAIREDLGYMYEEQYSYGFVEHMDVLSPANRIEYTCLNRNYTPMTVDIDGSHTANYGSWGSFPSLVQNKPYMVKSTGEEDYMLDEMDYTKKADGISDSDVSNTDYDGGAFSKFVKIYVKRWIEGNDRHVRFSFIPIKGYTACGFIGADGEEMDHVWLPMFYGSTVDGKMRSLSGLHPDINQNTSTQHTNITAFSTRAAFFAGPIIETIRDMLYMLFKTTDIQGACGYGNRNGYKSAEPPYYGVLPNDVVGGGQFYGTNDGKSLNKIFHSIVLGTYNQYQRDPYYLVVNGRFKVSTDYTYDLTGEAYTDTGIDEKEVTGDKWLYPNLCKVVDGFGSIPMEPFNGSTSTGYCDGVYHSSSAKNFLAVVLRFGNCDNGSTAGLGCLHLGNSAAAAHWSISVSVLLFPPVTA